MVKNRSIGNAGSDVSEGISSNRDRQIKKEAKQKVNNLPSAMLFLSTLQSSIFVLSAFLVIYKRLSEQYESTTTEKISKESQG